MDTSARTVSALLSAALPAARVECFGADELGRPVEAWQAESAKFSVTMPLSEPTAAALAATLTAAGCTAITISNTRIAMACPGASYARQRDCTWIAGRISDLAVPGLTTLRFTVSAEEAAALDRNFRRMVEAEDRKAGKPVALATCQNPDCGEEFRPTSGSVSKHHSRACFIADRRTKAEARRQADRSRNLTARERRAAKAVQS